MVVGVGVIAIPFVGVAVLLVGIAMTLIPSQVSRGTTRQRLVMLGDVSTLSKFDSILLGALFTILGIALLVFYFFIIPSE